MKVSNKFIQVRLNENIGEEDLNKCRFLEPLPEPRIHHSAICVRGLVIVTGGLKSLAVDMQMFMQVPCEQKCWAIPIHGCGGE